MKKLPAFIFFILMLSTMVSSAEVFRWTDDNGKIFFSDAPPKNKTATEVNIENTGKTGAQFANPEQVKNFERNAAKTPSGKHTPKKKINADCRRYISKLNKVEIYLEHTNSPQDQLKARDLRKLAKKNCGKTPLTQKFSDGYCKSYRQKLDKTKTYIEHTSSPRDEQKIKDLKMQIARECQ